MLKYEYNKARRSKGLNWKRLEEFFRRIKPETCAFLSMNWDTVIEEGISNAHGRFQFDYGCEAVNADFGKSEVEILNLEEARRLQVLKPHGSANWLYCDACRQLFWFDPSKTNRIAAQLFRASDWNVVHKFIHKPYDKQSVLRKCPSCNANALGTRFATFSYRKALDFPMHESSWRTAEHLLRDTKNWIFIGYSLPPADYEFKWLLKQVQLSRPIPPNLILVTGGGKNAAGITQLNYQKFFGPSLRRSSGRVFLEGLSTRTFDGLRGLGVLST